MSEPYGLADGVLRYIRDRWPGMTWLECVIATDNDISHYHFVGEIRRHGRVLRVRVSLPASHLLVPGTFDDQCYVIDMAVFNAIIRSVVADPNNAVVFESDR